MRSRLADHSQYVRECGHDLPEIRDWKWPSE
jgi:xylulose-5-phosphate/fructose-6-phosphate phosphoketolase